MSRRVLLMFTVCLTVLTVFQCAEQSGKTESDRRQSAQKTRVTPEDLQRRSTELEAMQAETEALYRSLKAKEMLLFEKQAELDSIKAALDKKELELLQREKAARSTRNTGTVFLIAGLALIFLALRKMTRGKEKASPKSATTKSADASKSEPKQNAGSSEPVEN